MLLMTPWSSLQSQKRVVPFEKSFQCLYLLCLAAPTPRVLLAGSWASSNPFEERVREPPLNYNKRLGEAERLFQAEVRDLTSWNVFLALEVNKLKKQLESAGHVLKSFCRGNF